MKLVAALCLIVPLMAKDKKPKPPEDSIDVVAHIPATGGPIRRFLTTEHFSSFYLYAEHEAGSSVTLIDVTKAHHPIVIAEVAYPSSAGSDNLVVVSGTSALVAGGTLAAANPPQTIRILDFSDPRSPKVAREFTGVTTINRDDRRGLIFLANADGVWILHQNRALDPEIEKAYAHHVVYDH